MIYVIFTCIPSARATHSPLSSTTLEYKTDPVCKQSLPNYLLGLPKREGNGDIANSRKDTSKKILSIPMLLPR